MIRNNSIKTITILAILVSLASILGIIDKIIMSSIIPSIPGLKIGIANIIVLYMLYNYSFKHSLILVILKSVIVCFLFGGITSFIIGGFSSIISCIIMYIIKKISKSKISIIGISIIGGFIHINSQLIIIKTIYKMGNIIYTYGIFLIIASLLTSFLVGVLAKNVNKSIQNVNKSQHC